MIHVFLVLYKYYKNNDIILIEVMHMDKIELVNFCDEDAIYKLLYKWCSNKFVYEWFEQRILSYDEIVKKI